MIFIACQRFQESPDTLKGYQDASIKEPKHFKKSLSDQESKTATAIVAAEDKNRDEYTLPHPIWSENEVDSVEINHRKPVTLSDKLAYQTVMLMRGSFDLASGYTIGKSLQTLDERSVLTRCIFLETVAGECRPLHPKTIALWALANRQYGQNFGHFQTFWPH